MRLHHIGIEVQDLYAIELFYRRVFGFRVRYRYVSANTPGLRTVFLERDGMQLELLERASRGSDFLEHRRVGPNHISFEVADVDAEFSRLSGLGLEGAALKAPRPTGDGFREFSLCDPEGNVVEISARIAPEPRYRVSAVLFDLDGTLVDSEENYFLADRELMARRGIDFTRSDKRRYVGGSNADMMVDLVRRYQLKDDPLALGEEKNRLYLEIAATRTRVYPKMKRFWDMVRTSGLRIGVVSGSSPAVLARLLDLVGLAQDAQAVVSAEEVPRGKPAPDSFLAAAQRLGVPPHECVVVEDGRFGVEAAHRAFMRCIAVPYLHDEPLDVAFSMAELLFETGMDDFDPEWALQWLEH